MGVGLSPPGRASSSDLLEALKASFILSGLKMPLVQVQVSPWTSYIILPPPPHLLIKALRLQRCYLSALTTKQQRITAVGTLSDVIFSRV